MNYILLEKKGHVAVATIHRPEVLNALNDTVLEELNELLAAIEADKSIYALILTGTGEKSFVAGADIEGLVHLTKSQGEECSMHGNKIFRRLEMLSIPTIAAVNGYALGGGCELSMCCDIRLCAESAIFGLPETGLGITPGYGGTQRLARLIGMGMAKQLVFSAKPIQADEAFRIGLVNGVYPADELMPAAEKLAERISRNAPIAVQAAKVAMNGGIQLPIDEALLLEAKMNGSCFETADQIEGMSAFLEKRRHEPYQNK